MNQRKSQIFALVGMLASMNLNATVSFTGIAEKYGEPNGCEDIVPDYAEAQGKSERQASDFCDAFSFKSMRVSDFTYEENCGNVRQGFFVGTRKTLRATAFYRCLQ